MQVGNSVIPEEDQKTRGMTNKQSLEGGFDKNNNKLITLEEMRL